MPGKKWHYYPELRPDQLEKAVRDCPALFWPLGLLEHHGYHLPVGLDGLKAEYFLKQVAAETGGVVLPTMWWGGGGGHGPFKWTLYQDVQTGGAVVETTVTKLIRCGFKAFILLAGHYPWVPLLDKILGPMREKRPDLLFIWGTEMDIGKPEIELPGDHAGKWETAYGQALFNDLVDPKAMGRPHDNSVWPEHKPPPLKDRHPDVDYDPASPTFAQAFSDARETDPEEGRRLLRELKRVLVKKVGSYLQLLDRIV